MNSNVVMDHASRKKRNVTVAMTVKMAPMSLTAKHHHQDAVLENSVAKLGNVLAKVESVTDMLTAGMEAMKMNVVSLILIILFNLIRY